MSDFLSSKKLNRSIGWKLVNSLWIILPFIYFPWGGFLYIGSKGKCKKWKIYGIVYLLVFFFLIYLISAPASDGVIGLSVIGYWWIGITHSLIVRNDYLLRLDVILDNMEVTDDTQYHQMRSSVERELGIAPRQIEPNMPEQLEVPPPASMPTTPAESVKRTLDIISAESGSAQSGVAAESSLASNSSGGLVDINTCTSEELMMLPGVSADEADKAMEYRRSFGGFADTDKFISCIGAKPHIAVKLRPLITCSKPVKQAARHGRVLDI